MSITNFDTDMFIVLDEDGEPMLLSQVGEFPGIQSNKANLRHPVKKSNWFHYLRFPHGKWKIQWEILSPMIWV